MRKIFLFMMTTLDGYYEGVDHDISWHNTDEEFEQFAVEQLDEVDTLVFGHTTYDMMAEFWPTDSAIDEDQETAIRMNRLRKVVFAHESFDATWENTEVSTDLIGKIKELKAEDGKDIAVLASSHIGAQLIQAGLLDEVRIMLNPVFIGDGSPLFEGLQSQMKLEQTRQFTNGNILLTYVPR